MWDIEKEYKHHRWEGNSGLGMRSLVDIYFINHQIIWYIYDIQRMFSLLLKRENIWAGDLVACHACGLWFNLEKHVEAEAEG